MINKFKFKRYKIEYKKKTYYLFIPFEFDQLWIMDWADDWYGGAWIEGNIRCLSYLIAGFCILAFNPYAIVYYPVKKNKKPNFFEEDDGDYDIIFKSTKIFVKDKDIKNIVDNLKYYKWTTYKVKIDLRRMKDYFHTNIRKICKIPKEKILFNADGHINYNIAYYSFPQVYYQQQVITLVEYFINDVFLRKDFKDCYDKQYNYFHKPFTSFVWNGKKKSKFTYNKPSLTLYIEFLDIDIINKYTKFQINLKK